MPGEDEREEPLLEEIPVKPAQSNPFLGLVLMGVVMIVMAYLSATVIMVIHMPKGH